jgi:hypothetical protein
MEWLKEWAIVISGGATLLLAIAAFISIIQVKLTRRREIKFRNLREVIDWATEMARIAVPDTDQRLENIGVKKIKEIYDGEIAKLSAYRLMRATATHIRQLGIRESKTLNKNFDRVVTEYGRMMGLLVAFSNRQWNEKQLIKALHAIQIQKARVYTVAMIIIADCVQNMR